MALIFDRKEFKSGVQLVKELVKTDKKSEDGKPVMELRTHSFSVADKGKSFEFANEAEVLKQYPHLFKKA